MTIVPLDRVVLREDETPFTKEFTPREGVQILIFRDLRWQVLPGMPADSVTLLDLLRAVFASKQREEKKESLRRKGELLKKLNGATRKQVPFKISGADVDFITDEAAKVLDTVPFVQLDDILHERPTIGDPDPNSDEAIPEGDR